MARVPETVLDLPETDIAANLGIVAAVDVSTDGTIHLLESTASLVRRVAPNGRILPPLDIADAGGGRMELPVLLATAPDGTCFVAFAWSRRFAVIPGDGQAPYVDEVFDLGEVWPRRFLLRLATCGERCLLLASRGPSPEPPPDSPARATTTLVAISDGIATPLMQTGAPDLQPGSDAITVHGARQVVTGWDVNADGELAYGAPDGSYALMIRNLKTGTEVRVAMVEQADDTERLRAAGVARGRAPDVSGIPRVAAVRWLDRNRLLVEPVVEIADNRSSGIGVREVVARDGTGFGRIDILCPFDRDDDKMFIRNGRLVVLAGELAFHRWASALSRHDGAGDGDPPAVGEPPLRHLRCYDLRRIASFR